MNEFRPMIELEARQLMADRLATARARHGKPARTTGTTRHRLTRRLRATADRLDG